MSERMVYGNAVFAPVSDGSTVPANYTTGKSQFALFRMAPRYISNRQWYWLRDVVSAARFAFVSSGGVASYGFAGGVGGVRPVLRNQRSVIAPHHCGAACGILR